jgi:hypothetical protein
VVRAAANERGCWVAGTVVIKYACGKGGTRSVGVGRAWRTERALGMVASEVGMVRACGPVAGSVRAVDREWRWGVGLPPDMLARIVSPPSLLSPLGWQG